jgi:putative Mn2+ efflux pump MntP
MNLPFIEIFLIGIGVSMDAFAVSIGKGLCLKEVHWKDCLKVGLWFGLFQALMPLIGYYASISFTSLVQEIDHWIAFVMLGLIGGNMIKESLQAQKEEEQVCKTRREELAFKSMLLLAIATSIDALACGVSFAFLDYPIFESIAIIGLTTFFFSFWGIRLGHRIGTRMHKGVEIFGGIVLISIGAKILLEHLLG